MIRTLIEKIHEKTFVRFILVGVANTLFGTAIMFLLYNVLNQSYWISSAANYIFGSILSYFLNKYYTFKNHEKSVAQVVRFVVNIAVCYLVAYGAAKPAVAYLLQNSSVKVRDNIAMLTGMGLFVCLNYFGQRFFAFRGGRS